MQCANPHPDIEETIPTPRNLSDKQAVLHQIIHDLLTTPIATPEDFTKFIRQAQKTYHLTLPHAQLLYAYRTLVKSGQITAKPSYESFMKAKSVRSQSGVMVVTVLTSPWPETAEHEYGTDHDARLADQFNKDDQMVNLSKTFKHFSCKYDCFYCPAEPGMPRSYLMKEPAVARGNQHRFDAVAQFRDRGQCYLVNGHPFDKIELLVLGGTWSSYPLDYQETFIRDLYYAANTFDDLNFTSSPRPRLSLPEEIKLNETSTSRIIGLTLETRPDQINPTELRRYRYFGVTRVQLGIQHTDNDILRYVNRRCTNEIAIDAIRQLKECGFKVDIHLMPDLPSSSVETDRQMFESVRTSEDYQPDQIKIYPCEVVPWTRIERWYQNYKRNYDVVANPDNLGPNDNRVYHPYADDKYDLTLGERTIVTNPLFELLIEVSAKMPPWVRVNRIIRDIPMSYVSGGNDCANLRQNIDSELAKRGLACQCIRCREVKTRKTDLATAELHVYKYRASGGDEYFLAIESPDKTILYGFLRLRLSTNAGAGIFPELERTAMIRELHVYGKVVPVAQKATDETVPQHGGFGKQLLRAAENMAQENGFRRISVIAGVGVRNYYRKQGYLDDGAYQIKTLTAPSLSSLLIRLMSWQ
jgi:histone acetyltransferase (RNA polymerase elongator complex component)